jgi:6-phosphogluconolactonase
MNVFRFRREGDWLNAAISEFISAARLARYAGRMSCHFCLAGGSTPVGLYRRLAASPEVAEAFLGLGVELWLGDERVVAWDDGARNGNMVESIFASAPWRPFIHLWPELPAPPDSDCPPTLAGPGKKACEAAAAAYACELESVLGSSPAFDLSLLGLGADGHTASLFPGDSILAETRLLASTSTAPTSPQIRLSLTYPALAHSRNLRFFVRGKDKLAVVDALGGLASIGHDPVGLPAAHLDGPSTVLFYFED